jgi:hypothetical protein
MQAGVAMITTTYPTIVLGMHRSGTSLLTRILSELGVYIGLEKAPLFESRFFFRLNEGILETAQAQWDDPEPVALLWRDPAKSAQVIDTLKQAVKSDAFNKNYLGEPEASGFLESHEMFWGWKDPRNTLTWPFWHAVFPQARYVFIYRHGVDVARSLYQREIRRENPQDLYRSLRCSTMAGGFSLWEVYHTMFFEALSQNPQIPVFWVRFEELLQKPEPVLNQLLEFLGVSATPHVIANAAALVDKGRPQSILFNAHSQDVVTDIQYQDSPIVRQLYPEYCESL